MDVHIATEILFELRKISRLLEELNKKSEKEEEQS